MTLHATAALRLLGIACLVWIASRDPVGPGVGPRADRREALPAGAGRPGGPSAAGETGIARTVARVEEALRVRWRERDVDPAGPATPLEVLRRLSLALHGTIPSLEEIRRFEADAGPGRLERWTDRMLADRRFGEYMARRWVRPLVGVDDGPFLVFRRDRLVAWLAGRIGPGSPFDATVRDLVSERGLWTQRPATNFVTATLVDGEVDAAKLAGRTVRAFLGQRMDCARCHDHPFDDWTRDQFEGLAAFYAGTRVGPLGVADGSGVLRVEDDPRTPARTVSAAVPYGSEWLPAGGLPRSRLAAWLTHPRNRRFPRAVVNRMWGLVFGRPYHAPVDDLPDPPGDDAAPLQRASAGKSDEGRAGGIPPPPAPQAGDVIDVLARDFAAAGHDLSRLVRILTRLSVFRASSRPGGDAASPHLATAGERNEERAGGALSRRGGRDQARNWAVFPLVALRPEQIIGSLLQSTSIRTLDRDAHLLQRFIRLVWEKEFLERFGDPGEDELLDRLATVPQRLLLLNGKLATEATDPENPFYAVGRIAGMAPDDDAAIETSYLICLTRRPTPKERDHFLHVLRKAGDEAPSPPLATAGERDRERAAGRAPEARNQALQDLLWTLINTTEFSWNH